MQTVENWIQTGILGVGKHGTGRPFQMRFIRASELDALYRLHQLVVSGLEHPHIFRPDSRAFMEQHIGRRGRTVGVFVEEQLIAYAAISFPDGDPDNLAHDLPLPAEEFSHVADYDGSAVHPDYRGHHLQRRMTEMRHRYALAYDRYHILGTVSPINPRSLANFIAMGCLVRNIKQKYGGMTRLIIHRDLRERRALAFESGSIRSVPLTDIDQMAALLARAYVGTQVIFDGVQPRLGMVRPIPSLAVADDRIADEFTAGLLDPTGGETAKIVPKGADTGMYRGKLSHRDDVGGFAPPGEG